MLYRLKRDWRGYHAGKVFEPTPGAAEILLRRKIIEPVTEPKVQSPKSKVGRKTSS